MKTKKNSLTKAIALVLIILCFGTVVLTGCAKNNDNADSADVTQMYIDKNKERGIDWDDVIANLKKHDNSGSGLYVDKENLEENAKEFYTVTFTNYDPAVKNSFKEVDNQITVSYGIGTKNEYAYETPEFYDEPVVEVHILNNSTGKSYSSVYNEEKELLSEDGEWFLDTDKDETISAYLDESLIAVGILNRGE